MSSVRRRIERARKRRGLPVVVLPDRRFVGGYAKPVRPDVHVVEVGHDDADLLVLALLGTRLARGRRA